MKRRVLKFTFVALVMCIALLGGMTLGLAEQSGSNVTTADLKALIDQYHGDGEFANQDAPRVLNTHLTAIGHFEKQGANDKVIQHMDGFFMLLNQQKEQGVITNQAYSTLKFKADIMVGNEHIRTIVQDGEAIADILVSSTASDMEVLAANELRDTLQLISGAEVPVVKGDISGESVSIQLQQSEFHLTDIGEFAFGVDLMNNTDSEAAIEFTQADEGPMTLHVASGVILASGAVQHVPGVIVVPGTIEDGTHSAELEVSVDGEVAQTLILTITLDRNLILNSDFEQGLRNWWAPAGVSFWDDSEARSGDYSLRIEAPSSGSTYFRTDHPLHLVQGQEYVLKAWMKGEQTGDVTIEYRNLPGDVQNTRRIVTIGEDWTLVELIYVHQPQVDHDYSWLNFWVRDTSINGNGTLWIDDVTFTPIVRDEHERNLVLNSGFEHGLGDWWAPAGVAVWDNTEAYSGNSSMRMVLPPSNSTYARTDHPIHMEPGQEYVFKAWMKGEASGELTVEFRNLPGDVQNTKHTVQVGTDWTYVEINHTRNPNLDYTYNWLNFWIKGSSLNGTGDLWLDDVTFSPVGQDEDTTPEGPAPAIDDASERVRFILATPQSYPALTELFPDDVAFLADSDGFAIRQIGQYIYIFGSEPKGVLNGVYDFLEENTDIIWTRAEENGTLYDPQSTILANEVQYREKSPFKLRGWHTTGVGAAGQYHSDPATERMLARNKNNAKLAEFGNLHLWQDHERLGIKPYSIGHDLTYWLPSSEYFDTHPEYFNTDADGNYIPGTGQTQINFYHPDVPYVIAERVKDFLEVNPVNYIGMGINDTHYWEQGDVGNAPFTTEEGIVVYPEEEDYKSTVFFTFLNKLAREVKQTHPDVTINTFAYFFAEVPPRVELEDNIAIVMAPINGDDRLPINTDKESSNNEVVRKLTGWLEKTDNIMMYNYYGSFRSDTYERPIAAKVQADMQYYRDLGLMGVVPEGFTDARTPRWAINAMQLWLFNQLYWDPDADLEALKTKYIEKAYGEAADAMRTYYDLIEQGWNYDQQPIRYNTTPSTYIGTYIIKAGIQHAAQAALDEAWSLANDDEKARIEPIKTTFEEMTFQFAELPDLSATAVKTTASKEDILAGLDFSQGPWVDADPVTDFYYLRTANPAPVETRVRLLWDDENLYVGYENMDDDVSQIVASDTAPNEWWASGADDDVETFITGDLSGTQYYVFFTNSKAVKFEYDGPNINSGFDTEWEAYAEIKDDRWNAIQVIPFASINVDSSATDTLKAYFFRQYHGHTATFGWGGGSVWDWSSFHTITLEE